MATKRAKWSEAQIKAHIQTIQKVIEKGKRENKGEHFIGITPEQIREKLKRVNPPSRFWDGIRPPREEPSTLTLASSTQTRRQQVRYLPMSGSAPATLIPQLARSCSMSTRASRA